MRRLPIRFNLNFLIELSQKTESTLFNLLWYNRIRKGDRLFEYPFIWSIDQPPPRQFVVSQIPIDPGN